MTSQKPVRPFISLRNAAFRLGESTVFERTSWTFHTHEHWAIIGANGSGKSLLADGLRGLLPLAAGKPAVSLVTETTRRPDGRRTPPV